MKTISIRELHEKTGAWVRRTVEETEIVVTDRGRAIAYLHPYPAQVSPKQSWKNRPLHPDYAVALKEGRLKSTTDSSTEVSEERNAWH